MSAPEGGSESVVAQSGTTSQLIGALGVGLLLVIPLQAVLRTETYSALYLWIIGAILAAVIVGAVLRVVGVPKGISVAGCAAGTFALLAVAALVLIASAGDPGTHTQVALMSGFPAAVLAAPIAVALVRFGGPGAGLIATIVALIGLAAAGAAGPWVGMELEDARDDARDIARLESSSLSPLLPEVDGWEPSFVSTTTQGGRVIEYSLSYEPEGGSETALGSGFTVSIESVPAIVACDVQLQTCEDHGDYIIARTPGADTEVVTADVDGTRLTANFSVGDGEQADPDEVGRALADAESVEWSELVGLDD